MCQVCDSWRNAQGSAAAGASAGPGSGVSSGTAADTRQADDGRYTFLSTLPANRPGRTFTWSAVTHRFANDPRQQYLEYRLNDASHATLRRAFAVWAAAANVNFREVRDDAQNDFRIGIGGIDGRDNILARAHSWGRNDVQTSAAIEFDRADLLPGNNVSFTVAIHEIGHALGLGHSSNPDAIMYYRLVDRTTLHADDLAGIRALYSRSSTPGDPPSPPGDPPPRDTAPPATDLGNLTALAVQRTVSGTMNGVSDRDDRYRFVLDTTATIRIVLHNLSADADLVLLAASGGVVAWSARSGTLDDSIVRSLGAGTYYVRVDAVENGAVGYRLSYSNESVRGTPQWPPAATSLGDLTALSNVRGSVGSVNRVNGPDDYYRFELTSPHTMRIGLHRLSGDADLYLYSASGTLIASSTEFGTGEETILTSLARGSYYIRVKADDSGSISYRLTYLNQTAAAPPGSTLETAYNIGDATGQSAWRTLNGTVNSETNDDDYFRFTVRGTRTIRIELRELSGDADLYLLDASGTEIARSDNQSRETDALERDLAAGTYHIRVDAYDEGTVRYRLAWRDLTPAGPDPRSPDAVDIGDATNVAARSVSGTVNAASDSADRFRFTLRETRPVTLHLRDLSGDADLYLYDASGRELAWSEAYGSVDETIERALGAGTYEVAVRAYGDSTIAYRLEGSTIDWSLPGAVVGLGSLTSLGGERSRRGSVGASERVDLYRFTLDATRQVTLGLTDLTGDADLHLFDDRRTRLASSDAAGTAGETIALSLAPGTYYVAVDAWRADNIGYRLGYRSETVSRPPGTTWETAVDLGSLTRVSTWRARSGTVNTVSRDNYYRFSLGARRLVTLELRNLSGDADLFLYTANGDFIDSSVNFFNNSESIGRLLDAGTYYVLVADPFGVDLGISYRLGYRSESPESRPGTTWETAIDLGAITYTATDRVRTGSVNAAYPTDYYRFSLEAASSVTIGLSNLSGDVDLFLYDSSGSEIDYSLNYGTLDDSIQRPLSAGTYYVLVSDVLDSGGTISYRLAYRGESPDLATPGSAIAVSPDSDSPQYWAADPVAAARPLWKDDRKPLAGQSAILAA